MTKAAREMPTTKKSGEVVPPLFYITEQLRPLAVPIDDLIPDPANARKHNDENLTAICASLRVYGQRKPVVVNRRNGVVEAGNGTLTAARHLQWSHIAVVYVDDDPSTAAGYGISDNRTAELASWDADALDKLLREINTGDEDLQAMLSALAEQEDIIPPDDDPTEPPIPESNYSEQYGVIVICSGEEHQKEVYEQLQSQGMECKVVVT